MKHGLKTHGSPEVQSGSSCLEPSWNLGARVHHEANVITLQQNAAWLCRRCSSSLIIHIYTTAYSYHISASAWVCDPQLRGSLNFSSLDPSFCSEFRHQPIARRVFFFTMISCIKWHYFLSIIWVCMMLSWNKGQQSCPLHHQWLDSCTCKISRIVGCSSGNGTSKYSIGFGHIGTRYSSKPKMRPSIRRSACSWSQTWTESWRRRRRRSQDFLITKNLHS